MQMDPFTQGVLGAAASQSIYARKLKKDAAIIGAIAAIVPDLDIFIHSNTNPSLFFIYHRQFSHSLFFIPIGGLIIGLLYLLFIKRSRIHWPAVLIAAIIGYGTHGLLDATTTYGTVLFWPFSNMRVALDYMSIMDPIFSAILILGVFFSFRKNSHFPVIIALVFATLYICFGAWQHFRAEIVQLRVANKRGELIVKRKVMPALFNLLSWHSIYIAKNNKIYIDEIHTPLFKESYAKSITELPLAQLKNLPKYIQHNKNLIKDFNVFKWFTDGFISQSSTNPIIIVDTRYFFSFNPIIALWGIEFPQNLSRKHIYFRRQVRGIVNTHLKTTNSKDARSIKN